VIKVKSVSHIQAGWSVVSH